MAKDRPLLHCRCSFWPCTWLSVPMWRIGFLVLFGIVLYSDAQYASEPANGAVYIGTMGCQTPTAPSGIRIFLDVFSAEGVQARLQFYPVEDAEYPCTGEVAMTGVWNISNQRELTLTPTGMLSQTCAYSPFGLDGSLSDDVQTFSGLTVDSPNCQTFTARLQNSWGGAVPCPQGYYQNMGATFLCDVVGPIGDPDLYIGTNSTGSVKLFMDAATVTMGNFYLPRGVQFGDLMVSVDIDESVVKMTLLDNKYEEVENRVTNESTIQCGPNPSGQTCSITGTLPVDYYFSFTNTSMTEDNVTLTLSYSYMNLVCNSSAPIGCNKLDESEAILALRYFSYLLGDSYTVPDFALEDTWAIPWYLWRSWWSSILGATSPWEPTHYASFRVADLNNDGYVSMTELAVRRGTLEPRCPSGYYKSALAVVGCNAYSGVFNITLLPDTTQGEIQLPAYINSWRYTVTSMAVGEYSDIQMLDTSGTIAFTTEATNVANTSTAGALPAYGNVNLVSGGEYSVQPYREYVGVTGRTTLALSLQIITRQVGDGVEGTVAFSHQGVSPCSSMPSGCSTYNEPLATMTLSIWAQELRRKGYTAGSSWQWCNASGYVVFGWGITEDKWNVMWREVLNPLSTFNAAQSGGRRLLRTTFEERQRLWDTTVSAYDRISFDYCDTNTDFMVSEPEYMVCFNTVLYCPNGGIQFNIILFSCDAHVGMVAHGASMDRNYTIFEIPEGTYDFNVKMASVAGGALTPGFMFSLNTTASNCTLLNGNTEINCTGNLTGVAVLVTLHAPAVANLDTSVPMPQRKDYIMFTYSYGASLRRQCLSNPNTRHWGCADYNVPLAESQLLIWSQSLSSSYNLVSNAWNLDASRYSIEGLGIPYSNWVHLGCRLPATCSLEALGNTFHKIDINLNGYIDPVESLSPEFAIAFRMSGSHLSNHVQGCFVTAQYDQTTFPLSELTLPASCSCARKLGIGWNDQLEKCVTNADTLCEHCPNQPKCAYMETAIGDGLQDFYGDCILSDSSECLRARRVSLSQPVSIAIDEEDNIYIADYGNNRVRMVNKAETQTVTIAGSGLVGFSGDGGLGIDAKLRYPESVTVNIVGCSSAAREVYFTDSLNQRIRKVVRGVYTIAGGGTTENWTISTVAGTGATGENPACNAPSSDANTGCAALDAIFSNPRAISLSRAGDLYIADSGNRKIRRLRNGIISTFVGSGALVHPRFRPELEIREKLLPGHWSELNEDVAFQSLYFLKVDRDDNLWFVDGGNNRIFMAPLSQHVDISYTGLVGVYAGSYARHFLDDSLSSNRTLRARQAQGLITWLTVEGLLTEVPTRNAFASTYQAGRSYWRYGLTKDGSWCNGRSFNARSKCGPTKSQQTQFGEIMGMCFAFASSSEIYVSDRRNSELVKIVKEPSMTLSQGGLQASAVEERRTTRDCACLKYWVDWQTYGAGPGREGADIFRNLLMILDTQAAAVGGSTRVFTFCRENPDVQQYIMQYSSPQAIQQLAQQLGGDAQGGASMANFWMRVLELLPSCTVTNYCQDNAPVPWCYVNTTDLASNHPCNPVDGGDLWGFCYQNNVPPVEWQEMPATALYSNENRDFRISSHYMGDLETQGDFFTSLRGKIAWSNHQMLTSALPDAGYYKASHSMFVLAQRSDMGVKLWSFLLGFKEPRILHLNGTITYISQIWNATKMDGVNCNITCCGLPTETSADGEVYCMIDNEQDFQVAENVGKGIAILMPEVVERDMLTIRPPFSNPNSFTVLKGGLLAENSRLTFTWSSPVSYSTVDQCQERCEMNPVCQAYMTYPQVPQCVDEADQGTELLFCTGDLYCAAPDKAKCGIQTFKRPDDTTVTCDCTGCGTRPAAICRRGDGVYNCVTYVKTDPYEVYILDRSNMSWTDALVTMPALYGTVTDLFVVSPTTLHYHPVTVFNWTSEPDTDGYIGGPFSQQALLVEACKDLCENHTSCVSIVNPGCYLMARSNWGPVQSTRSPLYQTKVFSKVNADSLIQGIAGLPGVYAFEGDMRRPGLQSVRSSLASRSLVNRPSSCEVNSKGHLLFADTWNQRIRKVSNLSPICNSQARLFNPQMIATWMGRVNNVSRLCSAVFPANVWKDMFSEAVKDRISSLMYRYLCHDDSKTNTELQTTNLQVLCTICAEYSNTRPILCPTEELCACRQAFIEALTTEVYLNCPEDSAFSDPWHRLLTAYVGCWTGPDVNIAAFLTEPILKSTIRQVLESGVST